MSGRWEHSTRAARLPADWPHRRTLTRLRAGGRCQAVEDGVRCPSPGAECDHIIPGDDHRLSNLQWLCRPCHQAKTLREAAAGLAAMPRMRRPPEKHPAFG